MKVFIRFRVTRTSPKAPEELVQLFHIFVKRMTVYHKVIDKDLDKFFHIPEGLVRLPLNMGDRIGESHRTGPQQGIKRRVFREATMVDHGEPMI